MGKILDTARCYVCKGKIDVDKLIRAPADGANANFCSKKCYKQFCMTSKDKDHVNQYKQRCSNK